MHNPKERKKETYNMKPKNKSYECTRCAKIHFNTETLYLEHLFYQSKQGISDTHLFPKHKLSDWDFALEVTNAANSIVRELNPYTIIAEYEQKLSKEMPIDIRINSTMKHIYVEYFSDENTVRITTDVSL